MPKDKIVVEQLNPANDPFEELKAENITVEIPKKPKVKPKQEIVEKLPINTEELLKKTEVKSTPEDLEKMRNLKQKIRLYKQHFPNETKDINVSNLDSMSVDDLNNKLQECRMSINTSNPTGLITLTYGAGIGIAENLSIFTPFRLQGLTQATATNESIRKALLELEIEYGNFNAIESPEKRLVIATLHQMWLVHRYNSDQQFQQSVNKKFESMKNEKVDLEKEYVDI